jgi:MHS family proline/betaine transporter-like MFS transporter
VFTLENHEKEHWGFYGSFVMAAANFGTLLGSFAGWALRSFLTDQQLHDWGWRIPFLSGIIVSISGFYLRGHGGDHPGAATPSNPIQLAFAKDNLRSLLASAMVPMLWSSGFYLSFVWMAIFMTDLIEKPVPGSFGVNACALFFSVCLLFPVAGALSDRYGRREIMTIGGLTMGLVSPFLVMLIGEGDAAVALVSQILIGISLSFWGSPLVAFLVESFEPEARLTSVAIGYNFAQATVGGLTPALATIMVDSVGPSSPGFLLTALASVGLVGLWFVAPAPTWHSSGCSEEVGEAGEIEIPTRGIQTNIRRRRKKETFSAVPVSDQDDHYEDEDSSHEDELL